MDVNFVVFGQTCKRYIATALLYLSHLADFNFLSFASTGPLDVIPTYLVQYAYIRMWFVVYSIILIQTEVVGKNELSDLK